MTKYRQNKIVQYKNQLQELVWQGLRSHPKPSEVSLESYLHNKIAEFAHTIY